MKTYTYRILRPFRYPGNRIYFIWLILILSSFGIFIVLGLLKFHFLALTLLLSSLILTNVIAVKILLKTEFVGQFTIDDKIIRLNEKPIEYENISRLTLRPYISRSRSLYIPRWKLCEELEIKLNDKSEYKLLISKDYPTLTPPIFDVLEKIKNTKKEYYKKIELPNRTGFFSKK